MAKLVDEFIKYLEGEVKKGSIYVWGAQGQTGSAITESWIRSRETSDTNANRAINFWKKQLAAGYKNLSAFDCSGLGIYWLYNKKKLISGDMSSGTMYNKCVKISRADLKRGDWVFRANSDGIYHIGYVVDDALNVIEAMGRDAGVVKRSLKDSGSSYWNKYGRPAWIFGENMDRKADGSAADVVAPNTEAFHAICSGGSVHVRRGRGTNYPSLDIIKKGECLLAFPDVNGWCEIVYSTERGKFATGFMSAKYVKKI